MPAIQPVSCVANVPATIACKPNRGALVNESRESVDTTFESVEEILPHRRARKHKSGPELDDKTFK